MKILLNKLFKLTFYIIILILKYMIIEHKLISEIIEEFPFLR